MKRMEEIRKIIEAKGEVKISELIRLFPNVSEMTIRRDLTHLEEMRVIVRTRGGAKSVAHLSKGMEAAYSLRLTENVEKKALIAKKAMPYLQNDDILYFDAGTTVLNVALLMNVKPAKIVTSGINTALELAKFGNHMVEIVGGALSPSSMCVSGIDAIRYIEMMNFDTAFIAASGYDKKVGFTTGNYYEALLKKTAIQRAKQVILLMDSTKIGRVFPYTFAQKEDFDVLLCDKSFEEEME